MHKLEITTAPCLICGTGNTPKNDGTRREFVDLEREVNWNDPAILCEDCLMQAAALIGMLSPDVLQEMKAEMRAKDREVHDVKVEMDRMKRRAKKLGIAFEKPESAVA
jgi:hypothetical protein